MMTQEPIVLDWIEDLKHIFYKRIEELNLDNIDLERGRIVDGIYEFSIWDTDGHRIDFKISQLKNARGWMEANRTNKPDPDIKNKPSNSKPFHSGSSEIKQNWGWE